MKGNSSLGNQILEKKLFLKTVVLPIGKVGAKPPLKLSYNF